MPLNFLTSSYRYLSTWFLFDVCSTAPLQSLSLLFTDHNGALGFKALNMLRLWRLRRVSSLFARSITQHLRTCIFRMFGKFEKLILNALFYNNKLFQPAEIVEPTILPNTYVCAFLGCLANRIPDWSSWFEQLILNAVFHNNKLFQLAKIVKPTILPNTLCTCIFRMFGKSDI